MLTNERTNKPITRGTNKQTNKQTRRIVIHLVDVTRKTVLQRDRRQESCAIAKMTAQCALYMGALKIFGTLTTPTAIIPNIFHGILFRSTLWMFLQNLKSVALPVPEIIGGIQKIWAVPGYAHAPFSPKCLMGFYSDWLCNVPAKFEVCSFIISWNKRGS